MSSHIVSSTPWRPFCFSDTKTKLILHEHWFGEQQPTVFCHITASHKTVSKRPRKSRDWCCATFWPLAGSAVINNLTQSSRPPQPHQLLQPVSARNLLSLSWPICFGRQLFYSVEKVVENSLDGLMSLPSAKCMKQIYHINPSVPLWSNHIEYSSLRY